MTQAKAIQESLKVEWKVSLCSSGESCWCRIIEPVEPIIYGDNGDSMYIVGDAAVTKEQAEHIVRLQNSQFMNK